MTEIPKDGYWHIRINFNKEAFFYDELDMSYKKLMNIVQKYNLNQSFTINGRIVKQNTDLKYILICHTKASHIFYGKGNSLYYEQWYVFEPNFCHDTEDFTNILLNPISENTTNVTGKKNTLSESNNNKNIFIVHGHDDGMKQTVARFLECIGLTPIILSEQPNEGQTIIEKLEKYIDNCNYGIVLYSPCDIGGINEEKVELKPRARQNVVFEHGYLIGKLGRKRVCCLLKDDIEKPEFEKPGDNDGIIYIYYTNNWKLILANELKAAKYDIDLNKLA